MGEVGQDYFRKGRSKTLKSGLEIYLGGTGRPLMFKRVNLISKASSNWKPSPDLSGAFSWRLGVKMVLQLGDQFRQKLVKLVWPPENWTAVSAVKWTVPAVLKLERTENGFPTVPPRSLLSEPQSCRSTC